MNDFVKHCLIPQVRFYLVLFKILWVIAALFLATAYVVFNIEELGVQLLSFKEIGLFLSGLLALLIIAAVGFYLMTKALVKLKKVQS